MIRLLTILLLLAVAPLWAAAPDAAPVLCLDTGGHTALVWQVLFTPDGKELVSVGDDKAVRVWDLETGEAVRTLRLPIGPGFEGRLYCAALSPDGKRLAVAGYAPGATGTISLLDYRTGILVRQLAGHENVVVGLAFSRDGGTLASAGLDRTARLWDPETGTCRQVLTGHTDGVRSVAFSPDGQRVASGSTDHTARLWDTKTGAVVQVLQGHAEDVTGVAWAPDGATVATGSTDRSVRLWDAAIGKPKATLPLLEDQLVSLAFSPDGARLAMGLRGGGKQGVRLWSVREGRVERDFAGHDNTVTSIAFRADGALLATAGGNAREILLWDPVTGAVRKRLAGRGLTCFSVAWSPDGQRVAWGTRGDGALWENRGPLERSFAPLTAAPGPEPAASERWVRAVPSRSGRELAPLPGSPELLLKEAGQEVARLRLTEPRDRVLCFGFTPTGEILVGGAAQLSLFDAAGQPRLEFVGHTNSIWALAVSPDGRYLASASGDQTVRIWPLRADGPKVAPLLSIFQGTDGEWVAWTPEGYYACSPGGERLIGWQVDHGPDRLPEYFPAYQFRRRLYRPDVITRLLESGTVAEAVRLADAERKDRTDAQLVADQLQRFTPPKLEVLSPAEGTAVAQPRVTVRARATDPNGRKVTGVTLLVNGRRTGERAFGVEARADGEVTADATLTPGENLLTLLAVNDAGAESLPVSLRLTYRVPETDLEKPALYVLSIGVSRYQNPDFNLRYPAKDAADVVAALQAQEGKLFRKVTGKVLTDAGATRDEVMDGLDWLGKQVTQKDWALVFVSGHGTTDNLNQYYFLPHNGDPERLKRTGVVWSDFRTTLANLPGKVVLVLDTCHSAGAALERTRGGDAYTDLLRDAITDEVGLITLASCMPREVSLERDEWQNGAFTRALVEALRGQADANQDGTVTLAEADAYVADRVKTLTDGRQHPTTNRPPTIRSSLPLAIVR